MKKYLLILAAILFLWGCIAEDRTECANPRSVFVSLTVRPERMSSVTRSADEYAIRDLNFYLYNDNGNVVLHRYQTSATLHFECLPGNYRMRIAANIGRDMGENPASEDFTITHAGEYDVLPMAYEGGVTIMPSADGVLTLPAVEVQRCVAKVSYNISVKPADIELRSVQLLSVPRSTSVFDAAAPSDNPDDYTDCLEVGLSGQQAAGDCYLLSNMQGSVSAITDQRQKNPDNAPANASYLLIRAVRGAKVLAYYVYLGGNNTSDFNVRANVHYRLNISILGDKEVDTRISSYTLRVRDDFDDYNYGGYCLLDGTRYLYIDVDSPDGTAPTRGRLEVLSGDLKCFTFNYGDKGAVHDFDLYDSSGENAYEMEYYTPVYTPENSLLSYRITLTDTLGFTQSYDFTHRMANASIIHTDGGGSVRVEGALHVETESEGPGVRTVALCMDNCTLIAVPDAGYAFDGWYNGPQEYGHLLSTEQTYEYVPLGPLRHIYAVFQPATTALDADGTANCYIARSLNTVYSFDAATMGNGRTTTNIVPKKLVGTEVKVLWETGTTRGAIVKSTELTDDGHIVFQTGMTYGNAVIGLFDASRNCIWSWHIWSVDYDIEATAQTYASGAVFMDRNLGALTTDCTQPSSRGLYYQWGRKDPFLPAATCQETVKRADAVYAAGFEYAENDPRSAASPYEMMSLAWSVSHPTTYMNGVFYEDWEEWASSADWLYDHRPNLWGNMTTGMNNIGRTSHKSIYDPCPPGWKIPCAEDFLGIERVSQTMPYYVTVRYDGSGTTRIPLGGTFSEGRYMANGQTGRLYTNNPYHYKWESNSSVFSDISCTSICFSTGSAPYIGTTDYYRYAANPVRCIKE